MTFSQFLALRAAGKELPGLGNIELIRDLETTDWAPATLQDVSGGPTDGLPGPELPAPDSLIGPGPYDPRGGKQPGNPTEADAPRLAINLVSFYLNEEGPFNDPAVMVGDTLGLDAAVVRQPGLLNLFLSHIYDISGTDASVRMPAITRSDFRIPILRARIEGCDSWRYLKDVVTQINHQGGSSETTTLSDSAPENEGQANPIFVPWSEELDGTTARDAVTGETVSFDVGDDEWRRFTLDPHNGVKRLLRHRLQRHQPRRLVP